MIEGLKAHVPACKTKALTSTMFVRIRGEIIKFHTEDTDSRPMKLLRAHTLIGGRKMTYGWFG